MTRQKHGLVPARPFGTLFSTLPSDIVTGTALEVFDDLFRDMIGNQQRFKDTFKSRVEYPKTDIFTINDEDLLVFEMSVPGLAKEELNIVYENNSLCVTGEKTKAEENDNRKYLEKELKHSSFMRKWSLPKEILNLEENEIESSLKDGILTIIIPLKAAEKPKRLQVSIK